jgi:hypothetical protein
MLNLNELAQQYFACQSGSMSRDDFEDWFRTNARGSYRSADRRVREVYGAVEAAFSRYHFEGISEQELLQELANAIRPFAKAGFPVADRPKWVELTFGPIVGSTRFAPVRSSSLNSVQQLPLPAGEPLLVAS